MSTRREFLALTAAGAAGAMLPLSQANAKPEGKASGGAMLFIANDCKPGREKEFNYWYQTQHLDERLGIPGFLTARRYVALPGQADRQYMATYETESADTLKSHQYMKRLNDPTMLTAENMKLSFARMNRSLLDICWEDGKGTGVLMDLIVIRPTAKTLSIIKEKVAPLWQTEGKACFERAVYMQKADVGAKQTVSAETKLRGGPDEEFEAVLLLEWADVPSWPAPKLVDKIKKLGIDVEEKAGGRYRLVTIRA